MSVIDSINNSSGTAFTFEILPPLKGNSIQKVYNVIDKLREFEPKYINITSHRSELVYKAAYMMDTKQDATLNASMAKYYASEVCNEIAQKAVQIHGGYGFIKDYKIERMFRDCRVFTIYEGTSQVQQIVIGGKLLKK